MRRPLPLHQRVPPASLIAGATIIASGALLLATAALLPPLLLLSWAIVPSHAAEVAGLGWALLVGGAATVTAMQVSRQFGAANDNHLPALCVTESWVPVVADHATHTGLHIIAKPGVGDVQVGKP